MVLLTCCCRLLTVLFVLPQTLGPLLSCVEPADRISFIDPNFPQHYPAFQSPDPYYNPHNTLGEAPPTLQKPANPRLYMSRPSYEFQGYLTPPSYPVTTDLCDPRSDIQTIQVQDGPRIFHHKYPTCHLNCVYFKAVLFSYIYRMTPVLGSSSSSSSSTSAPLSASSSYDTQNKPPPGWKELLKTSTPYGDNHHYYSADYPCRYPTNTPGSPAALQTIITTTTKVRWVLLEISSV